MIANITSESLEHNSRDTGQVVEGAVATLLPRANPPKTISISQCKVRGEKMWRVRYHELGRTKRKFFTARTAADSFAATLRGDAVSARQKLALLPQEVLEKLLTIYNESTRRGCDLLTFLYAPAATGKTSPAIETVLKEIVKTKENANRASKYVGGFKGFCEKLAKGRETMPIDRFNVADVEAFIDGYPLASRPTVRSRISTLFQFAVRRGYRSDNPCNQLEPIEPNDPKREILTLDETKKCLQWFLANPRLLAWFALSTFAGLRPDEAMKTTWADINLKEGWIKVEAQTTKVGERRVVYPHATALAWIKKAQDLGAQLPLTTKQRVMEMKELRPVLGWGTWKQDVTRHTAASMWLAHSDSAEKVATALGNSEKILRKHYLALVTKVDAEKFWNLTPKAVKRKAK
jgi:integrase